MPYLRFYFSFVLILSLSACSSGGGGGAQVVSSGTNAVAARSAPLPANDTDCPSGGVLVETGIDENENGVLDADEVDKAEKVCNGTSGSNGLQSLVRLSDEDIGSDCPNGGVRIDSGIDTNRNGILDASEITETRFVCNPGRDRLFEAKEKLISFDPEELDRFGGSIAIEGDYAIVGASAEDPDALFNAGSAYIFRRTGNNTWDTGIKIVADDREEQDRFGISVAISGDYAIVGAPVEDPDLGTGPIDRAGAAYIFRRTGINTWDLGTKITAFDAEAEDNFGRSVSISGNYAIVGAQVKRITPAAFGLPRAGAAYIFRRTGDNSWDAGTRLISPNAVFNGSFGSGVAISGDYALVGAPGDNSPNGAAYVFKRTDINAWDSVQTITAALSNSLGQSVAISGDYALVGAPFELNTDVAAKTGAAHIFLRTGSNSWDAGTRILAPDGDADDQFGNSVAISGNTVIVGAFAEDPEGKATAGSAYVFRRTDANTWDSGTKITAADGEAGDSFGISVAISGSTAIVGANGDDDGAEAAGAAYIVR